MAMPFFAPGMAVKLKGAISIMMALLVFPAAGLSVKAPALDLTYIVLVGQEVLLGIVLGFVVQLCFTIISVAGEIISLEMGFKMATQVDPITGVNTPAITQFYQLFTFLIFMGFNGHYWIIEILSRSFGVAPIGSINLGAGFGEWLANLFSNFFTLGTQLAAPIFLLMLMITIGIGLLGKVVQGMNVMDIGFPIRIGGGLLLIAMFLPFLSRTLNHVFSAVQEGLLGLLTVI